MKQLINEHMYKMRHKCDDKLSVVNRLTLKSSMKIIIKTILVYIAPMSTIQVIQSVTSRQNRTIISGIGMNISKTTKNQTFYTKAMLVFKFCSSIFC